MRDPLAEAERWFRQAEFDLKVGRHAATGDFYFAACFHAQQAAEKALKACRYAQGEQIVIGHSVYRLAQECRSADARFVALARDCGRLDMFYIPTRYPNGLPDSIPAEVYTTAEAELAVDLAQRVLDLVAAVLGLSFTA
ncbi:MAG: DNA-binding protein [Chloroflexi bacterium HGW-Chloroflexi-1]|nr:MAG: DNA-binding protein [Chloroflexi bacterium HGW-Chloroflexi-1]